MGRGRRPEHDVGEGADGDKDGDGVSNVDEYRARTPPSVRHVRYFGDSSPGDRQRVTPCFSFRAPGQSYGQTWVRVRLIGDGGRRREASTLIWLGGSICPLPLDRYVADPVRLTSANRVPFVAEHTQEGARTPAGRWAFATPRMTEMGTTWAPAGTGSVVLVNPCERAADVQILATTVEDFCPERLFAIVVPPGRIAVFSPQDQGPGGDRPVGAGRRVRYEGGASSFCGPPKGCTSCRQKPSGTARAECTP